MVKFIIVTQRMKMATCRFYTVMVIGRCRLFTTIIIVFSNVRCKGWRLMMSSTFIPLKPYGKYDLFGSCVLDMFTYFFKS